MKSFIFRSKKNTREICFQKLMLIETIILITVKNSQKNRWNTATMFQFNKYSVFREIILLVFC